jgi:polysaccharide biosynthesis protein PslG
VRRLVIATTLLVCLGLAPHAGAATAPRGFYGVIPANDPDSTEIARMGAGKVGTLRINFVWGAVQPTAGGTLDFSHYDALIGAAAQQGIRVLPTVYSSPSWAASKSNFPPSKSHRNDFRAFVQAASARYGANGTFWSSNPTIPKLPIIDWQLWNEANSPSFWYRKPNPRQYVSLLRTFSGGIRAGDPSAKIVLTGLFLTPQVRHGIPLDRYLPAIYRAKAKPLFDAVALHPYATTPRDALNAVKEVRKIMGQFKDRSAPLWITEIGWATGGSATALTVSPQRQATYLKQTYSLMAANRGRFKIAGMIWYSWRDVPGGIWFNHTGLFTQDFDPKPAWDAFVGLTGGSAAAPAPTSGLPPIPLP